MKEETEEQEHDNQISLLEKFQKHLNIIQEKTGIKATFIILGLVLCVTFVYFNTFDSIITNLIGTLYPAFWTIKSIEEHSIEEQKKWLTYWVVFGSFIILDMSSIVIAKFIPFYFVLKILFLIWLFMPGSSGCTIIYYLVVKKIFRYYEDTIERYIIGAKDYLISILLNFQNKNLNKKMYEKEDKEKEKIL